MYKIILKDEGGDAIDERVVATDDEAFAMIGRFAVWYFLSLDAIDYKDAQWHHQEPEASRLLGFTCDKETDAVDGPHRHGMPKGVLARGRAWTWDAPKDGHKVQLVVERQ